MMSSLIGFSLGSTDGPFFHAVNPVTGKKLPTPYALSTDAEIQLACNMADQARLKLANFSGSEKAEFLRTLADLLEQAVEDLVPIMLSETGLPEPRIRAENGRTCGQLRMFADLVEQGNWVDARIDRAQLDRNPLPKPDLRSMLRPIGPVAVFCASNFPLAFSVAGGDSASAWAAGCPVIVKAHHAHPGTALLVGERVLQAMKSCSWPEGAFSLIFGEGKFAGRNLVLNPTIKAVGFTGSRAGGTAIMELASSRPEPIPVFAEMSSVNPIFVLPEYNIDKLETLTSGLASSATMGVGQFCTNPGIVFHPGGEWGSKFISLYAQKMKEAPLAPMLHKGINTSYENGLDRLGSCKGVNVVQRSNSSDGQEGCFAGTCVLTAKAKDFIDEPVMMDEVFGPSTLLVSYESTEELLQFAQIIEGQLTVSIFGEIEQLTSYQAFFDLLQTKTGRILCNQFPTGVEVCNSVVHGGPFPATSDSRSTSVGTNSILRFARPICFQGFPEELLPPELKNSNPLSINRIEN